MIRIVADSTCDLSRDLVEKPHAFFQLVLK